LLRKINFEIKSVSDLTKIHFKQLSTYLRFSYLKLGLLINFNEIDAQKINKESR